MNYISTKEAGEKWGISERSVRSYCKDGRVCGAVLIGGMWHVPCDAIKPSRKKSAEDLTDIIVAEKNNKYPNGLYHKLQVKIACDICRLGGSIITYEQADSIFTTRTIKPQLTDLYVDDIIKISNLFKCFDMIIENFRKTVTAKFISVIYAMLKTGAQLSADLTEQTLCVCNKRMSFYDKIGEYKLLAYKNTEDTEFVGLISFMILRECLKNNSISFMLKESMGMME